MSRRLYTRRLSDTGPDLLFLHGLYGAGRNWQSIGRELADRYRVWLVDLRNHGKSFHDPVWNYQVMAADVLALAEAEGLERVALVGHSMGGKVAMQFALDYPQRLSRLAIADIAPRAYDGQEHRQLLAALASLELDGLSSREQADRALQAAIPADDVRRFLLSNLSRGPQGWEWQLNLPVLQAGIDAILADIDTRSAPFTACPVLFLAGRSSSYLRPQDEARVREVFPAAVIERLDAGHWVQTEQPEKVLNLLRDFLAGIA